MKNLNARQGCLIVSVANFIFLQLASDAIYNGCNDLTIRLMAAAGVPVFSYVYDYIGDDNMQSNYTGTPGIHKTQ